MFIYKNKTNVYSLIPYFSFFSFFTKQDYLQTKQPTNLMHFNASPWDNKSVFQVMGKLKIQKVNIQNEIPYILHKRKI